MTEQFKYLFSPMKMGPMTVKNRIVSTPHGTGYFRLGLPTEQYAYYHAERAKGGAGLIQLEGGGIQAAPETELNKMMSEFILLYKEDCIPGFRRIVDMCHQYGAKVTIELFNFGTPRGKGPSTMPDLWNRLTARAMTVKEIEEWIESYGISAENARKAGFDGVEIHASHGFAVEQFLSPLWNRRTDKYGGPLEKRMTALLEIVDRVRQGIGDGLALGVRLNGDEMFPGGYTLEDGKRIAKILEETGKVDYLSIDTAFEPHQAHVMTAPMYAPHGHMVPAAAAIKEVLERIPVITAGRIIDPIHAEQILADGQADLVGMTRAQIADPEMANKARAGRLDDIRPCLGDNENCFTKVAAGGVMCTGNPRAGREAELGLEGIQPAKIKKRVVIAGGGPAGMEAARVAALRGHEVALYEKSEILGGQVNLAARLPGRDEIAGIIRWLEGQISKLGVEVHLSEEITAEKIQELKPDALILATGAAFYRDGFRGQTFSTIYGSDSANVVTPEDILSGKKIAGDKVVVVDETGFIVGLGLAEFLADQGKQVELVTSDPQVGPLLGRTLQGPWVFPRVMPKVTLTPQMLVTKISDRTVTLLQPYSYQESTIEGVDTVVLATAKEPNNALYYTLQGSGLEVHLIGDANHAMNGSDGIGRAVATGHDVARNL